MNSDLIHVPTTLSCFHGTLTRFHSSAVQLWHLCVGAGRLVREWLAYGLETAGWLTTGLLMTLGHLIRPRTRLTQQLVLRLTNQLLLRRRRIRLGLMTPVQPCRPVEEYGAARTGQQPPQPSELCRRAAVDSGRVVLGTPERGDVVRHASIVVHVRVGHTRVGGGTAGGVVVVLVALPRCHDRLTTVLARAVVPGVGALRGVGGADGAASTAEVEVAGATGAVEGRGVREWQCGQQQTEDSDDSG